MSHKWQFHLHGGVCLLNMSILTCTGFLQGRHGFPMSRDTKEKFYPGGWMYFWLGYTQSRVKVGAELKGPGRVPQDCEWRYGKDRAKGLWTGLGRSDRPKDRAKKGPGDWGRVKGQGVGSGAKASTSFRNGGQGVRQIVESRVRGWEQGYDTPKTPRGLGQEIVDKCSWFK